MHILRKLQAFSVSPAMLIYAGSLARAGFAFLLGVVVARQFGPEGLGLFHAYTVLMTLTLCLVGEALDHGLIRFYTYRLRHEPERAGDVLGSAIALRLGMTGMVACLGLGLAIAAPAILSTSELGQLLLPGILSGILAALVTMVGAIYLSEERFIARATLLPALAALRFCIVGGLAIAGGAAMASLIWLDAAVIGTFAVLSLFLVRKRLAAASASVATVTTLGRFSVWSIGATVPYLAYMGLGSPLLIYFHGPAAAGYFGVAISVAVLVEHATAAFISVLQREVSAIADEDELRMFRRKATRWSLMLTLALSPLVLFGGLLIPLAFGAEFEEARQLFPIIMIGALVYMLSMPRALIFFALDRPEKLSIGAGFGFVTWLVAALVLIPPYGAFGAACALVVARICQAALLTGMVSVAPLDAVARVQVKAAELRP